MQFKPRKTIAVLAMGVACLAAGLAQAQPVPPPPAMAEGYVLGPGDMIEVSVVGGNEGPMRVQIQSDGSILLPLIGNVTAGGKTVLQLRDDISTALQAGGFYTTPAVNVTIVTYASRYVTVLGAVAQPGAVPIERAYHVSDILARVGGVKDGSAKIVKIRRADGTELSLDIAGIATGGPDEDPIVAPGDKIFVPTAQTFYALGQVTRPGNYAVEEGMTLRKALAVAGGLTQLGSKKKVKVIRDGKELEHVGLDDPIEIGDVIEVGERFF
ncbi:SLBB domain-containing protein [Novosphingobium mangrovi (ex Huang et al. 2023)]|uniref:Polysaccharide export protein n=1 Tax=Novosphingobium mangrovi (ex Huang et al. 2023) TaxID=2976432 RepID=A0ABT2I0S9_9SPHN|nr:polysaccharide biosynthesis/export family protein [Novosphingobium mangrovi (ex Huang et al. 2023)]MCT2398408.1 polysaccharide export protein [Novosphingobium mangrovi (ex Huang et al. 2023)]